MGANRRLAVIVAVVLASATLVACTDVPDPAPDASTSVTASPSPSPSSAPPEPDPELIADGDAEDNLVYFDFVNARLLTGGNPGGRPIIDNLVSAGFDKTAMQVTADRTPRGSDVDSLQFSVRMGEDCLVGQVDAGGYLGAVVPGLESGSCLIGNTRSIDW